MGKQEPIGLLVKTLGQNVKTRRHNWTLKEVADRAGLSVSYLSDIENNRTVPSLMTLAKLGGVYNCTVVELLRDTAYDYLAWESVWDSRNDDAAEAAHHAMTGE